MTANRNLNTHLIRSALVVFAAFGTFAAQASTFVATTVIDGSITRYANNSPDVFNDHRYDNRANIMRCCDFSFGETRTIEEFQLPALDGPIQSATLSVVKNAIVSGGGGVVSVWGYDGDGLIAGAPLAASPNGVYIGVFPEFSAGDVLLGSFPFTTVENSNGSRVNLDITGYLQGEVQRGITWAGLNFRLASASVPDSLVSVWGEGRDQSTATYLVVSTVPLPSAFGMLLSGLVVLSRFRRNAAIGAP